MWGYSHFGGVPTNIQLFSFVVMTLSEVSEAFSLKHSTPHLMLLLEPQANLPLTPTTCQMRDPALLATGRLPECPSLTFKWTTPYPLLKLFIVF